MRGYVNFIVRHRVAVILSIFVATAFFCSELRHIRLDIPRRANLPQDHPYVQIQNRISDIFGGDSIIVVGLIANEGTIFTKPFLSKVWSFTHGLLEIPGVVETSLFSIAAPYVKEIVASEDGAMEVRTLMAKVPESAEQILELRNAILRDALFRENLISADETAALVVVDFGERLSDVQLVERINQLLDRERDETVTIALAGAPVLRAALAGYTALVAFLFPMAVLIVGFLHYAAFRTFQAMVLPLATALISVTWALGIMGALRAPMDTWSAMTPVLILAVAAGHAVQMLKRYYEQFAILGDNRQSVITSVVAVAPAMLTAGFIASAGFASLATFGISSVRTFGLLLASGILSALAIEMTFTPACRSLLPAPRQREALREQKNYILDRGLEILADTVVRCPLLVLSLVLSVSSLLTAGVLFLRADNSLRLWFPASSRIREDDALLNSRLAGTATLRLLIGGSQDGALYDPGVLRAVADLEDFLRNTDGIGSVTSIATHVKRMNRAMHNDDNSYYSIPGDRKLIAQYLFLYGMSAGPDGLSAFVDGTYRNAVVRALSTTDTAAFSRDLIENLNAYASSRFDGLPAVAEIAGGTLGVQTAMNDVIVREKVTNILQVAVIIFILCSIVLRSIVGALFVLIPLAVAVLTTLGIMGWVGIWLDMSTAGITAMGASIGADFAIYLIFRIREEREGGGTLEGAIREAVRTSGKAILFVSSAVAVGYLVLPLSGFSIWIRLGILTAGLVTMSAFGALTMIPALATITSPRFLDPPRIP